MLCSQEGSQWSIIVTWGIKVSYIMFLPFKIKLLLSLKGQEVFPIKNLPCVEHKSSQLKAEDGTQPFLPDTFSHLGLWGIKTTSNTFKFTINWSPKSRIFSKAEFWPQPHSRFVSEECKESVYPLRNPRRQNGISSDVRRLWHSLNQAIISKSLSAASFCNILSE